MRLDYLILYVEDVQGVAAWYDEQLGLDPEVETPDFVRLADEDGVGVAIHRGEPLANPERVQLEYRVDDVDEAYDRLSGRGVEFRAPPQQNPAGFRFVTTSDPAGHTVELRGDRE